MSQFFKPYAVVKVCVQSISTNKITRNCQEQHFNKVRYLIWLLLSPSCVEIVEWNEKSFLLNITIFLINTSLMLAVNFIFPSFSSLLYGLLLTVVIIEWEEHEEDEQEMDDARSFFLFTMKMNLACFTCNFHRDTKCYWHLWARERHFSILIRLTMSFKSLTWRKFLNDLSLSTTMCYAE